MSTDSELLYLPSCSAQHQLALGTAAPSSNHAGPLVGLDSQPSCVCKLAFSRLCCAPHIARECSVCLA
ncbi:hypothetical protein L596_006040 [Steinernema carpocapsae]|uniref:Uncharacterized protein n=1 Tax=Steinernema carpocapsae TaxID=34508 RepID=A0A4U8V0X5_STECR|nr:hypothetical protein L596_006040 [Steinernema carpocapsae]